MKIWARRVTFLAQEWRGPKRQARKDMGQNVQAPFDDLFIFDYLEMLLQITWLKNNWIRFNVNLANKERGPVWYCSSLWKFNCNKFTQSDKINNYFGMISRSCKSSNVDFWVAVSDPCGRPSCRTYPEASITSSNWSGKSDLRNFPKWEENTS